ncbi:hypothetical protein BJM49_11495 [Listeria monocytogenes]|nr:hypothetical protein [Listeria monocytogenes]OFG19379.1 hypothetical protein BJM49_11495 [Listeria monocytogenes]
METNNVVSIDTYKGKQIESSTIKSIKKGGAIMSQDFITKREFDEFSKRVEDKIDNQFQLIDKSINNLSDSIDLKLENALLKQADNDRKEVRENRRWIIGVLIFGIITAGTSIISLFI